MNEEGEDYNLFVLEEAVVPAASAGFICPLTVGGNNRTGGEEANNAPNLLMVRTSNLRLEYMAELCRQGISIDDDNDSAPENVSRQCETTVETDNWRI